MGCRAAAGEEWVLQVVDRGVQIDAHLDSFWKLCTELGGVVRPPASIRQDEALHALKLQARDTSMGMSILSKQAGC